MHIGELIATLANTETVSTLYTNIWAELESEWGPAEVNRSR